MLLFRALHSTLIPSFLYDSQDTLLSSSISCHFYKQNYSSCIQGSESNTVPVSSQFCSVLILECQRQLWKRSEVTLGQLGGLCIREKWKPHLFEPNWWKPHLFEPNWFFFLICIYMWLTCMCWFYVLMNMKLRSVLCAS